MKDYVLHILCHSDKNSQNVILGVYIFEDSEQVTEKEAELARIAYAGDIKLYKSRMKSSKKQLDVCKEAKEFIANNGYISSRDQESLYKRCKKANLLYRTKEMYGDFEKRITHIATSEKNIKIDIKKSKKKLKALKKMGSYTFQEAGYFWEESHFRTF
ncbi:hypothetical protein [Robinsoniella peoriensis]|uniref:hypothetical protein n=1 Tax=Robinsoniella peoriensis TaxID=180332 RepID=UPI00085C7539|nr:hypothetical protein [Robinsoniella peoriensis]